MRLLFTAPDLPDDDAAADDDDDDADDDGDGDVIACCLINAEMTKVCWIGSLQKLRLSTSRLSAIMLIP